LSNRRTRRETPRGEEREDRKKPSFGPSWLGEGDLYWGGHPECARDLVKKKLRILRKEIASNKKKSLRKHGGLRVNLSDWSKQIKSGSEANK